MQVTALRQRVGVDLDLVSRAIADAVSRELGEEPSGTWVTWQTLPPGAYREGVDDAPLDQPDATHPPIVRISAFEGRPPELVARVLSAVAGIVVRELGLQPGNAFVVWDELRAGNVHTGGGMPGHVGSLRGSRARRQSRDRDRLEPGHRPRHRDPARRGGCERRPLRARGRRARRHGALDRQARGGRSASSPTSRRRTGAAAVVAAAVEQLGGVDIVVNNVGGSGAKTFADMDAADLQAVLDKNLFPAVNVSHAALPSLRARGGGVIAMISSIWGREGGGAPSYNIAKAAEISLAKAMATDLAKDGVRVFSVAPGSTLFPGGSWERRTRDDPEGIAAFIERELPFGRLGTVDEIADVVTFMVSPRASWVVGTCVTVDGGQSRSF